MFLCLFVRQISCLWMLAKQQLGISKRTTAKILTLPDSGVIRWSRYKKNFGTNDKFCLRLLLQIFLWNAFSVQLQCCGFYNFTDFDNSPYYTSHNSSYPPQCCRNTNPPCNQTVAQSQVRTFEWKAASTHSWLIITVLLYFTFFIRWLMGAFQKSRNWLITTQWWLLQWPLGLQLWRYLHSAKTHWISYFKVFNLFNYRNIFFFQICAMVVSMILYCRIKSTTA